MIDESFHADENDAASSSLSGRGSRSWLAMCTLKVVMVVGFADLSLQNGCDCPTAYILNVVLFQLHNYISYIKSFIRQHLKSR